MIRALDTQSYVDKNWKYFYYSLGFLATTLAVFGSGRENYINFYGVTMLLIPFLIFFLCDNFRSRGLIKYNTYRKRQLEYITNNMNDEEIKNYLRVKPIIKTLIEEIKKEKDFNWELIEDKISDEAFLMLYPRYLQLKKKHNKDFKKMRRETLYEPFHDDNIEFINIYFDRMVDKLRPILSVSWVIIFFSYMFC